MVKKFFAVERTATCTQTQTQPTNTTTTTNEREKKKLNRIQHIMCYDQNETKPKKKNPDRSKNILNAKSVYSNRIIITTTTTIRVYWSNEEAKQNLFFFCSLIVFNGHHENLHLHQYRWIIAIFIFLI